MCQNTRNTHEKQKHTHTHVAYPESQMTHFTLQFVVNIHTQGWNESWSSFCLAHVLEHHLSVKKAYHELMADLPQMSPSGSPDKALVSTSNVSPVVLVLAWNQGTQSPGKPMGKSGKKLCNNNKTPCLLGDGTSRTMVKSSEICIEF